ncbi:hypothetical protein BHE90_003221 [Fusarium euwallaceae]|uniref:CHAT domain-containing protein n=1 Tax=Fusarium euwallaceae TaxID=1147111 RepID=A0A430M2T5_9HYPO|nr:hypothetical protein BHE90_003221 [Fusarium euwallaceae]
MDSQTLREGKTLEPKGLETSTTVEDKEDRVRQMELAGLNTQAEHSAWRDAMRDWGISLQYRYKTTAETRDFRKAIDIANAVLDSSSAVDPDDVDWLHQLIKLLIGELRGAPDGPDPAVVRKTIRFTEHCVAIAERRNSDEFYFRRILAELRITQWEQTSNSEILNLAIEDYEGARRVMPTKYQEANHILFPLQSLYAERLKATSNAKDIELIVLDEAIDIAEAALGECDEDSPERPCRLHGLSEHLATHHQHYGSRESLEKAIEKAKNSADLDEAIESSRRAVTQVPSDHFDSAEVIVTLGKLLKRRYELLNIPKDYDESILSFQRGWDCPNASPSVRIQAASHAAELLAAEFNWEECSLLLQKAVELLPMVSPRSLDHVDKQHALSEFSGLASRAAASVLKHKNCPYDALRLLELGRNMIAGQILELRTDILDLEKLDKELAEKFVNLRDELDAATINRVDESGHAPFNWEAHNQRRRQADHELQQVIKNIRAYPEFTNFLLPPTAQEIQNAASQGPIVVVNTSPFRCDAFIIQHHRIQLLELDRLTLEDVNVHVRRLNLGDLQPVLKWSWDAIAKPILTKLGLIQPVLDGNWSRLWWILTGPLCHLPIHGAGYHYQEDRDTVLDRVISSYASSIKAILYDRKHRLRHAAGCTKGKALLVPMPDTPGPQPINGVDRA